MDVYIIRPTGEKKITVSWLEAHSDVGNFIIQRGHAPMILIVSAKPIRVLLTSGKQESIEIPSGGILEVQRESLKLLLNE